MHKNEAKKLMEDFYQGYIKLVNNYFTSNEKEIFALINDEGCQKNIAMNKALELIFGDADELETSEIQPHLSALQGGLYETFRDAHKVNSNVREWNKQCKEIINDLSSHSNKLDF